MFGGNRNARDICSPNALSKTLETVESRVFPTATGAEGLGGAVIGGHGAGGGGRVGREGCGSAVQRLAFYNVGQLGIKVLCAAEWPL